MLSWELVPYVSALDQRWNNDTVPLPCITSWPLAGEDGRSYTLHRKDRSQVHDINLIGDPVPGDWVVALHVS